MMGPIEEIEMRNAIAIALRHEFNFMNAESDSWGKAANGVIEKANQYLKPNGLMLVVVPGEIPPASD